MLSSIPIENWPKWELTVKRQNLLGSDNSEANSRNKDEGFIFRNILV